MIYVLHHRGPDDTGFYLDKDVGLANARLSIIDIEGGHQPIQNEDGTVHVTYNGEIYNYRQLRLELEAQGHNFRTKSDTEVIVHSYEQYGEDFVKKLNGMFAIALWDSKQRKLILARDRMGIKPLYYTMQKSTLLFASEMKAILQTPLSRVVNLESLYSVLNLGYIPGTGTLIEGIYKLPPSSFLVYHDGSVRTETYWHLPTITATADADQLVDKLQSALEESNTRSVGSRRPSRMFPLGRPRHGYNNCLRLQSFEPTTEDVLHGFRRGDGRVCGRPFHSRSFRHRPPRAHR